MALPERSGEGRIGASLAAASYARGQDDTAGQCCHASCTTQSALCPIGTNSCRSAPEPLCPTLYGWLSCDELPLTLAGDMYLLSGLNYFVGRLHDGVESSTETMIIERTDP
jgi:hypothetical protein